MRPTLSSKLSLGRFRWNEGVACRHCHITCRGRGIPTTGSQDVNFLVVDCSSSYNAIIGRPTLNSWKAFTSTYHLSVKFPTKHGIGQVHGDQLAARECYLAMLAMDEQVQTMNIEERRVVAEPTEALENISLDEDDPDRKSTRLNSSHSEISRMPSSA